MTAKTTFLRPDFDKNIPDKVNETVEVESRHVLSTNEVRDWHSSIATSGFTSKTDGVYVFATKIDNIGHGNLFVGFTDEKTYDSESSGVPGDEFTGTSLACYDGDRYPGRVTYLSANITQKAKEIISILTISNNGGKKEIQWIVDGNDGPVQDCTRDFGNGDEIFPCFSFGERGLRLELIPFDQVKSRSPKIDELMKEYKKPTIQVTASAPSTSTAANDSLISQLRDQVGRSQGQLIQQSEKRIQQVEQQNAIWQEQLATAHEQNTNLLQQLTAKDQQQRETRESFLGQLDISHKQLELERAEHQKTRNLLHQIKMESKDMEIYYLTKEKESGQRRQREEENDQFKVKQEPETEEVNDKTKKKTINKPKKK